MSQIPLDQFEQYIDEPILKRGLDYFKSGAVEHLGKNDGNQNFMVNGSSAYRVQLQIKKDELVFQHCDCPFDLGPICKHVVAALFYTQQDVLDIAPKSKKTTSKPRKPRKSLDDKVDDILEELPKKELNAYLKILINEDNRLRRRFLAHFAYLNEKETKALYAKQVRAILKSASHNYGYVDRSGARQVGGATYALMKTGKEHLENGNHKSALYLSFAVLEEMTKALDFVDDSNADVGGNIDLALQVLEELSHTVLKTDLKKEFFDLCLRDFEKELFKGWDWHLQMLSLAANVSSDKKSAKIIKSLLDKAQLSEYEQEEAELIKLPLLRNLESPSAAKQYMYDNLQFAAFRRMALEELIAEKEFTKAAVIAEEGLEKDKERRAGLAQEWRNWQLQIAMASQDDEGVVKFARDLILENSYQDKMEYYHMLKARIPEDKWEDYLNELISEMRTSYSNFQHIGKFYIAEKWFDKLFHLVKQAHSINNVKEYEPYLVKEYTAELVELYENHIRRYLSENTGRNYYKQAVKEIRWIKKLGDMQRVENLVAFLRKEYANRPALLEELGRV